MSIEKNLTDYRRDYESTPLLREDVDSDPFEQFSIWLQTAIDSEVLDANSMMLATAGCDGQPSARIVLLKKVDESGFTWYTDSRSEKGQNLAENPRASLLFHWRDFNRQVRVRGIVEKLSAEQADSYFQSRPEGSRFSAASSHQSSQVKDRKQLEAAVETLRATWPEGNVPRPEAWIGYCLKPEYFEFWQGQSNRLHDRITYEKQDGQWQLGRLSP
ncbi:MAG: pyridoxamine 5'-phosphate oxidase [Gammaproteobacteria bacterium]|jgi:pyridoxamine 5'-phosphate oxidase